MFVNFVEDYMAIYGEEYITSNVHSLIHVVDDVERFGPLPTLSAYPFENALYGIKNMLRSGNKSLQQLANRLTELDKVSSFQTLPQYPYIKQYRNNVIELGIRKGFALNTKPQNSWFLTKNQKIIHFEGAIETEGSNFKIQGRMIIRMNDWFKLPFHSGLINIFCGKETKDNLSELGVYGMSDILCKLVAINDESSTVFVPLLHTIE